ncbi:MAG TPA: GNAT family N-acetyltransferase [Solirubrobacteraceae bacterium]|nr:GNAT family N-acetyltransferase [Solirubrobacteraceae bacterium]
MARTRVRRMADGDIEPSARVLARAFGIDASDDNRRRGEQRVAHLLASDPEGSFVGEQRGAITGMAQAYRREDLWCLSMLAVEPEAQGTGMGRTLFERALEYGDDGPGLIVASNDPRALRLYAAAGFSLRPAMEAWGTIDRRTFPADIAGVTRGTAGDVERVAGISRAVRGAPHTPEIAFALERGAELLLLADRGFAVAETGLGVWLLAARDDRAASALLWSALDVAGDVERPVRWITAGQDWAVDVVVRAGLQISAYGALCVRGHPGPLRPFLPSPPFA